MFALRPRPARPAASVAVCPPYLAVPSRARPRRPRRASRSPVARRGASPTGTRRARLGRRESHTRTTTPATARGLLATRARGLFATRATRTWCVTSSERRKTTRARTTRAPVARDGRDARRADARGRNDRGRDAAIATTRARVRGRSRAMRSSRARSSRADEGWISRIRRRRGARRRRRRWEGDGRAMGGRGASPRVDDGANATRGGLTETFYRRSRPTRLSR